MNRTPYAETEAMLLACDDHEADSGNHEPLDRYIVENFTPRERRRLSEVAALLEARAWAVRNKAVEEVESYEQA